MDDQGLGDGDDARARKRWAIAYGLLLSCVAAMVPISFYRVFGFTGRGQDAGIFQLIVFVIITVVGSVMAAESLSWKLARDRRRVLMLLTAGVAVSALVIAAVLWANDAYLCSPPGDKLLDICSEYELPSRY